MFRYMGLDMNKKLIFKKGYQIDIVDSDYNKNSIHVEDKDLVIVIVKMCHELFCPTCGSKIVEQETDYHVHLSLKDILPNNNGQFDYHIRDEFMYIFSNILEDDDDWQDIVVFDSKYIDLKIKLFTNEHSDLIKDLEEYLQYKVAVQFGFINLDSELDW